MATVSRTYMSDAAITATIDAMQEKEGHTYALELGYHDFSELMWVLKSYWDHNNSERGEWAGDFASSIAETLGVEMV